MSFLALSAIATIVLSILTTLGMMALGDPTARYPDWFLQTIGALFLGSAVAVGTTLIAAVVRFL